MTTLMQISDLHFGTEKPEVVTALETLARLKKPEVLVVSGDITQRATAKQFAHAKAFCDRLSAGHTLALPGNHDIPLFNVFARVFSPYTAFQKAFGQPLEQCLNTPRLMVVTVNTTRPWRHKNGEVSEAQIAWVCEQLASATDQQLRVVVVHQPIHVLRPEDEHDRLLGWRNATSAWAEAGADMVMGGHIHLPYVCELPTNGQDQGRRMWCVQAGTAVSTRVRREAPNSVNLVKFAQVDQTMRCSVERWDYQNFPYRSGNLQQARMDDGQFALAHTSILNLQRD